MKKDQIVNLLKLLCGMRAVVTGNMTFPDFLYDELEAVIDQLTEEVLND